MAWSRLTRACRRSVSVPCRPWACPCARESNAGRDHVARPSLTSFMTAPGHHGMRRKLSVDVGTSMLRRYTSHHYRQVTETPVAATLGADILAFQTPITIATAIREVYEKHYLLPAIQREFVWSTSQIEELF